MKSKTQKREEALIRLRSSNWDDSRAKRLGSQTMEEWADSKQARIDELELIIRRG